MEVSNIIAEIDGQIAKLQQARALLSDTAVKTVKGPGRPKGSKNSKAVTTGAKRKLSPEGRKRIAEAMTRRWAERKKQVVKTASTSSKTAATLSKAASTPK